MTKDITQPIYELVHAVVILLDEYPLLPEIKCRQKIDPKYLGYGNPKIACGLLQVSSVNVSLTLAKLYQKTGWIKVRKFIIHPKHWSKKQQTQIKKRLQNLGVEEIQFVKNRHSLNSVLASYLLQDNSHKTEDRGKDLLYA